MISTGRISGWVAGLLLLQCQAGSAPSAWIRVHAPEFELLTSGDAQTALEAAEELEALRAHWRAISPVRPAVEPGTRQLRIVAFASEPEYQPFRVNSFSPAYFVGGSGQDTIVLGRLAKENFPALRHEYIHHLLRSRWQRLPLWLEEGLADWQGGVEPGVAQLRVERLRRGGLLPLRELASVVKSSVEYQDRQPALQFYAQSWALAHLLMTDAAYRPEAWTLVNRLNQGESLESAVVWVYGRGLPKLEADLATHLGRLKAADRLSRPALRPAVASRAGADEVGLALAGLLLHDGDTGGAQRYLDRVADTSRDNPELWSLIGDLALQQGRALDARFALREALRLGGLDPKALRQLTALEQSAAESRR